MTSPQIEPGKRYPLGLRVLGTAAAGLFVAWWIAALLRHLWAPRSPSVSHPYGVTFKGGQVFYFPQAVGIFMNYFLWFFFAVLVTVAVWDLVLRRRAGARG